MAADGLAARRAAVALLDAVLGERRLLSDVLAEPNGPIATLTPADRGRAQRLAMTVLRHVEQANRLLDPHLRRDPPRTVANILRLAVVELAVDRAAAHGVVNAAVEMTRHGRRTGHLTGLVNAVLRKLSDKPDLFAGMPPQRMPQWLRQPLVRRWGREAVTAIEAVQSAPAPVDLTLKPGMTPPPGAERLPTGNWRMRDGGQITALPGYATGEWWVQDAAAALPARILAPAPGDRVLDLCAAPGGKTLQLAAAGARVTALDISGPRLKRLAENLDRTGLSAEVVAADALHWSTDQAFDAVLLDAPCSATGTIRRHPDLPFVKDGSEMAELVQLQARLFDRALALLRPGGRLVYCTCSLFAEEGEDQVTAALARHPGLAVSAPEAEGLAPEWTTPEGGLRLRPDHWALDGGIDGFYIALLRKPAEA